jgi:hypothetical protein
VEDRVQELPTSTGLVACRASEATQVTLCAPTTACQELFGCWLVTLTRERHGRTPARHAAARRSRMSSRARSDCEAVVHEHGHRPQNEGLTGIRPRLVLCARSGRSPGRAAVTRPGTRVGPGRCRRGRLRCRAPWVLWVCDPQAVRRSYFRAALTGRSSDRVTTLETTITATGRTRGDVSSSFRPSGLRANSSARHFRFSRPRWGKSGISIGIDCCLIRWPSGGKPLARRGPVRQGELCSRVRSGPVQGRPMQPRPQDRPGPPAANRRCAGACEP